MTKIKTPFLYRIGKCILGPIFRVYYGPKIIGKENIPKEGNCILASNHIHLYDQCSTIISFKRCITYMAKKEYFDNKKTNWFFRGVGCIPVDRTKKDDNATSEALKVLNNGGAIGIFPEGTRNALKEERIKPYYEEYFNDMEYEVFKKKIFSMKPRISEIKYLEELYKNKKISLEEFKSNIYEPDKYLLDLLNNKKITKKEYINANLLDLKFGTVSMASKTDSWIVPSIITGKYKFRSKNLIVRFGKPFKVGNMDLAEANKKLRNEMIKLYEENMND